MGNVDFVIPYTQGDGSGDTAVNAGYTIEKFA